MWAELKLNNFKSFRNAVVPLGPFTVIVGTNASGKSNLRDAFRFLHGVGLRFLLAEIVGSKYGDGGELVWRGIRGGVRELAFAGEDRFDIAAATLSPSLRYRLGVHLNDRFGPILAAETIEYRGEPVLNVQADSARRLDIQIRREAGREARPVTRFFDTSPSIGLLRPDDGLGGDADNGVQLLLARLASVRFLDLSPERMRQPSFPGQTVLGDQGENLSSVLQAIAEDSSRREALLEWVRELTPMDAVDFKFPPDQIGRVLVTLIEKDGRHISAYSASDGTLRFLAMAAALLGPKPAALYFIEELDNGIHPTRMHLLLQLIERTVRRGQTQVIATTHSPNLLGLLSESAIADALLVYRLPGEPDSRVKRIADLPDAPRLIASQSAGRLHVSGWFEDIVEFTEADDE